MKKDNAICLIGGVGICIIIMVLYDAPYIKQSLLCFGFNLLWIAFVVLFYKEK